MREAKGEKENERMRKGDEDIKRKKERKDERISKRENNEIRQKCSDHTSHK